MHPQATPHPQVASRDALRAPQARPCQAALHSYLGACRSVQHEFAEAAEQVASSELRYLFRRYELLHARLVERLLHHAAAAGVRVASEEVADTGQPSPDASAGDRGLVESCLLEQRALLERTRALRAAVPSLAAALDRSAHGMSGICDDLAHYLDTRYLGTAAGNPRPAEELFEGGTAPHREPTRYD
jgi:hypothetical protein